MVYGVHHCDNQSGFYCQMSQDNNVMIMDNRHYGMMKMYLVANMMKELSKVMMSPALLFLSLVRLVTSDFGFTSGCGGFSTAVL